MTSWSSATLLTGRFIDQFIRLAVYARNPRRVNVVAGERVGADWLNALEEVGGRLVPAARNFVDSQAVPMPGAGVTGVRWLADCLDHFLDRDAISPGDDLFVEGAGALLGLLLIEHLGGCTRERSGRHRVQLGRFGWFDPFRAIEEALDAEDPRLCLSEYLSVAEREADQSGPISRVVGVFAEILGRERPDLRIESQFELMVELSSGASIDLARLERVARDQDDRATAEAARRIISMLPGDGTQLEPRWAEAAPRLVPRLVSEKFLGTIPNERPLYTDPIGHDVHLALQLRYGPRARYVRASEIESWAAENGDAPATAIDNLAAKSRKLQLERLAGEVFRVCHGDGLDAARLLLPNLATRLEHWSLGAWIAAAPHRDVLLVAPAHSAGELSRQAKDALERAPHPISAALFSITKGGLFPFDR